MGLAGTLVLLGSACTTASYMSTTYVGISPQIVTTSCRDAYEVYDKRDAHKVLVVSHIFREFAGCTGPGGSSLAGEAGRRQRFEQAAASYLTDNRRSDCRTLGTTALSALHYEFTYACTKPDPLPKAAQKLGRS